MAGITETLRILQPHPGLFAYYDGRIAGRRLHSPGPNWLDDGAYALGIASYAVVDGDEALVYDTHVSLDHARAIRAHLEGLGVASLRVVLSHWHDDHVAGNAVFADCEIIALKRTAEALSAHRDELEKADPPIAPLVMPNRLFEGGLDLAVGRTRVELRPFDIHSADGNVLWLPESGVLLAGDTLEDTITYVSEPEHIDAHIRELGRLRGWPIARILPNHGDPGRIASGGYEASLIDANRTYLERLRAESARPPGEAPALRDFIAGDIASGAVLYFEPYEDVHRKNIAAVGNAG
ncbi:MBL fold metallo-hydrolase [Labrys monachus]|uniref:Glyoxylase-like metal-dependent hydrolase (Beta-lactamase superfamily II) n=1 Tax=Labrys monachus TaxID=217067 RepID=A0ABU0F8U8_9HYPH|nr:MBL fold metallo-hydrolase [Labrys monachus]MDQ0391028.1 glyoxylase-like metal-dependent hydrolase (beta-lactamase superfamily II) [Labrys monachus]